MEEEKTETRHKRLLFILIALVLLSVIVGAIVIYINIKKAEDLSAFKESESELPVELQSDDLSPEDEVIKETSIMLGDPNYTEKDIEAYYDNKINQALDEDNIGLAMNIIIQKMNFLAVDKNDCESASNYINSIDLSPYNAEDKRYLASYIISMAISCNNPDLKTQWENIYYGKTTENE